MEQNKNSTTSSSSLPFTVALGDPFVCVMLLPCIGWTVNHSHLVVVMLDVHRQAPAPVCFCTNFPFFHLSVDTGASPFNRPRSSSMDPFIQSLSIKPIVLSPCSKTQTKFDKSEQETSYLVIGRDEARKEQQYANYQPDVGVGNKSTKFHKGSALVPEKIRLPKSDKPETSSNSTSFTVAPSVSSSSSSAPSSSAPLSPVSFNCNLKSPGSLQDSTISRLIDAVSSSHEEDTCGSISALIGHFESTVNKSDHTAISHGETSLALSNTKPTALTRSEELQASSSPLKTNTAHKNLISSPRKFVSKAGACATLSSPETAELEEVYTILDEEVLSPVSVYNPSKKPVLVQADALESTPSTSLGSSPAKPLQGLRRERHMKWDDRHAKRVESNKTVEVEERIYEEVFDPPTPLSERDRIHPQRYISSPVNSDFYRFRHDAARHAFAEVEINVDEDPLEISSIIARHASQQDKHLSPTKQNAIYQNEEPTPNSQQKQHYLCSDYQKQDVSYGSQFDFLPGLSPSNNRVHNHQQNQNTSYSSPFPRQTLNSRTSNPSPLHQNPQRNPEVFHNSRDINNLHTQQSSYRCNQTPSRPHQDSPRYRQIEREQESCPREGFSSAENLAGRHPVFANDFSKDRRLYSPTVDTNSVYSHLDYGCFTPHLESPTPQNTQAPYQDQIKSSTPKQQWAPPDSLNNRRHQSQLESRISKHSNESPLPVKSLSGVVVPTVSSPCKSKSLGDLTSEDISCNFQSKYRIISRSFITPHMRQQRRKAMGDGTFQSQSCDPLTEQLRKLVSLERDDIDRDKPQPPHLQPGSHQSQPQALSPAPSPRDMDDSPPPLTRRLSSRSQSRVRHINSRARERQQEALKPRTGVTVNSNSSSVGGVVLRNKSTSHNPPPNRHSTGSYIAGYLGQLEDRGLPEGACTSLHYRNGDHYRDRFNTDDSFPVAESNHSASEPEVYFLLRL